MQEYLPRSIPVTDRETSKAFAASAAVPAAPVTGKWISIDTASPYATESDKATTRTSIAGPLFIGREEDPDSPTDRLWPGYALCRGNHKSCLKSPQESGAESRITFYQE